jgi:hypothetical protein
MPSDEATEERAIRMIFFLDVVDKITVGESHESLLASFRRGEQADG